MKGMCGIESARTVRPDFQPADIFESAYPGRCPGLPWIGALPLWNGTRSLLLVSANGATHASPGDSTSFDIPLLVSANGATHASPGQRPGNEIHITTKALQGRPN